jgi:hypothetical protein
MALTAIHPGEHLSKELGVLDMSAAELARKIISLAQALSFG